MQCSIAHNPVRKYCAHKAVIHQWWQPVESWDCDQQVSTLWRLSTAASFTGLQKYLLCFSDSTRKSIELSVYWRFICLTFQIQLSLCPVELSECGKTPEQSSSIYFLYPLPFELLAVCQLPPSGFHLWSPTSCIHPKGLFWTLHKWVGNLWESNLHLAKYLNVHVVFN